MKITPVLGFKDGEAYPYTRVRSRSQAIDYLVNFVKSFPKIDKLAVEDATTPDEAKIIVDRLSDTFPRERIYRTKFSPVIGTHVGPHVLAVSVLAGD